MNKLRLRIIFLSALVLVIITLHYALATNSTFLGFYIHYIFQPLQHFRSFLLNKVPLSLGDFLYLMLGLALLLLLIRVIYFLFTIKKNRNDLWTELLRLLTFPTVIYLLFIILWGGNYARPPLFAHWDLNQVTWNEEALVKLTKELVTKMNMERPQVNSFPGLRQVNKQANADYQEWAQHKLALLKVKPTTLGYMLNYIGIQGYYNPLSGEAQFNKFIPPFMHPFVVSHEMAHQVGIAAEDEANLIAYILCAESHHVAFRYSAYFNLFLYAYSELRDRDSTIAKDVFSSLNRQSQGDLETLRAMQRKYRSSFRRFTTSLYDEYLRFHGQQKGIATYSEVVRWAYYWEQSHKKKTDLAICP